MTEPHHLTAAEQIHRGTFAEMHVEEVVDTLWPDLVGHIGTDHHDNSLELYFVERAPADLSCTPEQAKVVWALGFHRFWCNFVDGTEQYCHEGRVFHRMKGAMSRGGSKSTLRPRLQRRVRDLEVSVAHIQGELVMMSGIVSLIGAALNGDLTAETKYAGKPIAVVEKAIEMKARVG